MAGYYRCFCRNFSAIVHPLTSLLSPKVQFVWTPECQHTFESVKSLLSHAPVLAAPDFSRPFKLEVDASAVGARAVLLQEDAEGLTIPYLTFLESLTSTSPNIPQLKKKPLPCCLLSCTLKCMLVPVRY